MIIVPIGAVQERYIFYKKNFAVFWSGSIWRRNDAALLDLDLHSQYIQWQIFKKNNLALNPKVSQIPYFVRDLSRLGILTLFTLLSLVGSTCEGGSRSRVPWARGRWPHPREQSHSRDHGRSAPRSPSYHRGAPRTCATTACCVIVFGLSRLKQALVSMRDRIRIQRAKPLRIHADQYGYGSWSDFAVNFYIKVFISNNHPDVGTQPFLMDWNLDYLLILVNFLAPGSWPRSAGESINAHSDPHPQHYHKSSATQEKGKAQLPTKFKWLSKSFKVKRTGIWNHWSTCKYLWTSVATISNDRQLITHIFIQNQNGKKRYGTTWYTTVLVATLR